MKITLTKSILVYPSDTTPTSAGQNLEVNEVIADELIRAGYAQKMGDEPLNKMELPVKNKSK
jgi:hypothetical protein